MAIVNNKAYKAYNNLMQGYREGDLALGFDHIKNTMFVQGATSLASMKLSSLFSDDPEFANKL